jgi:hypothetical protein
MKTKLTPIKELRPGDKVYVAWPSDIKRPDWHKFPDILTVRSIVLNPATVNIMESGGVCLQANEFHKVLSTPVQIPHKKEQQLSMF